MAVAIGCKTVALGWLCVISFGPWTQLPPAVVRGQFQGFQIVGHQGNTVGAGNLLSAHFIGTHGIQILPPLGPRVENRSAGRNRGIFVGRRVDCRPVFRGR